MKYIYRDSHFDPVPTAQMILEAKARRAAEKHIVTMDLKARYAHVNPERWASAVKPGRKCLGAVHRKDSYA